jgi:hypothetical protein
MFFLLLLWDFCRQTVELALSPIDLTLDFGALQGIEDNRGADQAPVCPASDGHHHLEIAQ